MPSEPLRTAAEDLTDYASCVEQNFLVGETEREEFAARVAKSEKAILDAAEILSRIKEKYDNILHVPIDVGSDIGDLLDVLGEAFEEKADA